MLQFRKLANFHILKICKTIKIPKTLNLVNYHTYILSVRRLKKVKVKKKFKNGKIE